MILEQADRKTSQDIWRFNLATLLMALLVPVLFPGRFGLFASLVPLPVFYTLVSLGREQGTRLIGLSLLATGIIAAITGNLPGFLFTATLTPLGMSLYRSLENQEQPVRAGVRGSITLLVFWLVFWAAFGLFRNINPYWALQEGIDQGFAALLSQFQETANLPADAMNRAVETLRLLRQTIPSLLPGLLLAGLLGTVWINLCLGSIILRRKYPAYTPWPEYRHWRLPEYLVWFFIAGMLGWLLLSEPFSIIGMNCIILFGMLYFFQGLAVLFSLLDRWAAPKPLRIFIYALIFIQSYGIIILAFLGLIDVWADLRQTTKSQDAAGPPGDSE